MTKVKVALVGIGYWGKNYFRICSQLTNDVELVCVCDAFPATIEAFKQNNPNFPTATTITEMLTNHPDVQLVIVVTPATLHFPTVKQCLEAKKHVLVEKPLTTKIGEGEALSQIAKDNGVFLLVGHTYLFNKAVHEMKNLMNQAEFGSIYSIYSVRAALGPIRNDVGAEWDLLPHDISIMQYLVDNVKPISVSATGSNVLKSRPNLIDNCYVTITYPGGLVAHAYVSWVDADKTRQFTVIGSKRRIVFDDCVPNDKKVKYINNGAIEVQENNKTIVQVNSQDTQYKYLDLPAFEPLKDQVVYFLNCIRDNKPPMSDGDFGVVVVRIMRAIEMSIAKGGIPIAYDEVCDA